MATLQRIRNHGVFLLVIVGLAMLAFILNSGQNPLIIDQPEDDLDNSLIHKLIVFFLLIKIY